MRSRLCFLYPGILGACECTWKYRWPIDRFHSARNQGHVKWMSLIACGSIYEGLEWFSDDSRGRGDFCVWLLYYSMWAIQFAESRMKVPRYRSSPTSWDQFFSSAYSAAVKFQPKLLLFGVNCRLQLAGLGKKKRGNCEANLFYVESDFGTTDTTDKSFTVLHSFRC